MGWKGAEEDGSTKAPFSCPLLTCKLPVLSSRAHTLKVNKQINTFLKQMKLFRPDETFIICDEVLLVLSFGGTV